jgi:adenylate cyclase
MPHPWCARDWISMTNDSDSLQTVFFADVAGSARLRDKLAAGESQWAIDRCLKRMERAVEIFKGRLLKMVGTELMAVFATADAAFQAAIEMKQRVDDLPPVSGIKLQIRVGFTLARTAVGDDALDAEALRLAGCLVGMAEPGQLLTSSLLQVALSRPLQQATRDLGRASLGEAFPGVSAFEVFALHLPAAMIPASTTVLAAAEPLPSKGVRLLLRYDNEVVILDDTRLSVSLGREAGSGIVVKSHRVSRNHARIEKRGDCFVLIDTSTNGSYLTQHGKPELPLRREECEIQGKGIISFAAPAASPEADCLEFEQLTSS